MTEFSHLIDAEDDGLEPASYRQHTLEKLSIVHYYLTGFDRACARTKRYGGWTFVDSFAGSGLVKVRDSDRLFEGSTLVGLRSGSSRVHAIDHDESKIAALAERAERRRLDPILRTHIGDANQIIAGIVNEIRPRTPVFVLHDPEGMELAWNTVKSVANAQSGERRYKPEQLINFTAGVVRLFWREQELTDPNARALNRFFGSDEWRGIDQARRNGVIDGRQAITRAVELYKKRLSRDLGYAHVLDKPIHRDTVTHGHLAYHLLFASDVDAAEDIMTYAFGYGFIGQPRFRQPGFE